jgi:predicted amidohydrolase YtcJ
MRALYDFLAKHLLQETFDPRAAVEPEGPSTQPALPPARCLSLSRVATVLFALVQIFTPHWACAKEYPPKPRARTEVFTGRFLTLDTLAPRADAIAVRDGRIIAIGTQEQVNAVAGSSVRHTRLPGVALPGLADAHVHAAGLGEVLQMLDLRSVAKAQLLVRVSAAAARAPVGGWVRGSGWDQSYWNPPEFPTAAELDRVSAGHPVILERIDGHAVWANSRAMQLAGVTRSTKDPTGGRIIRDAAGAPSGVFVDDAVELVRRAMPPLPMPERVRRLRLALLRYAQWGLTSIHDAGIELADIAAYKALAKEGPLPVRVYAMASASDSTLPVVLPQGPVIGEFHGTFTLRCIKVVEDGALGSRGARLSLPYSDEKAQRGLQLVSRAQLDSIIARSLARGFQVAVHAIGDASNHDVLDAFERAGPLARKSRFRIEHASMIRDEDLPRLAALGVIASMQPVFVGEYSRFAEARVGAARLPWTYRTRDIVASGAVVASGTDFPASDSGDPIATLYSMVTRRGADGSPATGWLPAQSVSVDVALRSMTSGAAWAAFEENEGGMLRVGRRADLTVLSADPTAVPPAELRSLRVIRTIVGGRTTFR